MKPIYYILSFLLLTFICCGQLADNPNTHKIINEKGLTILTRFDTTAGYARKPVAAHSFAAYLRNLPLKPAGTVVKLYNGESKSAHVYDAVVNLDIGKKDLQQCADAVMRLRAEYFYAQKMYDSISFNLTNGFKVDYAHWVKGNRVEVDGDITTWKKKAAPSNTYNDFRAYMDFVFTYAGTLSLSRSLHWKALKDIAIGDVFIIGGTPGHAVIVVDVCENTAGEKLFMLAQSYMPAQDIQILKNPNDSVLSPWYSSNIPELLVTPEYTFGVDQLMTW